MKTEVQRRGKIGSATRCVKPWFSFRCGRPQVPALSFHPVFPMGGTAVKALHLLIWDPFPNSHYPQRSFRLEKSSLSLWKSESTHQKPQVIGMILMYFTIRWKRQRRVKPHSLGVYKAFASCVHFFQYIFFFRSIIYTYSVELWHPEFRMMTQKCGRRDH